MKERESGFSLIELLVVVAVILIIVAIAIPNFLRAKIAANESSAVSSCHAISTAEISYATMFPNVGFSAALANLGDGGTQPCPLTPAASCFVDDVLASGTKSGYTFTYVQDNSTTPSQGFTLNANPVTASVTGQRGFYVDQTNVIRASPTAPANAGSPSL
ncbi:MAG TPA: prepilin-type N-terminal cleavage/methylation domain-containing protein [Candidatus Limnocylindrales bacterium]|nr:prepilin-type N-terminal cleavage/methylation domain-containing protein [Candidatus Limnocylindrales bacterium]